MFARCKLSYFRSQNLRLKLVAFDFDRHSKTSEIGSTSIPLKDIKNLSSGENITLTNYLAQKRQEFGEVMLGLSYLPTAQRLSFNVVKATNLKFEAITPNVDNFSNIKFRWKKSQVCRHFPSSFSPQPLTFVSYR